MRRTSDLIKDYPDEALLEEVRRVARLVERPVLTRDDFTKHSGISADVLRRRFGSWRAVLERAGAGHMCSKEAVEPGRSYLAKYTDEELLKEVRRVAGLVDKPVLTRHDFTRHTGLSADALRRRFGGWRAVLERAGVGHMCSKEAAEPGRSCLAKYTDEELLEKVRRVAGLVDKPVLTRLDFTRHTGLSADALRRHFGSWRALLERAGLGQMYFRGDEELLEELRRVAGVVGKSLLITTDFSRHSKINHCTIMHRFGGWRAALERAGLGHMYYYAAPEGAHARITDEQLLEEVRRAAESVEGPALTMADFAKHSEISAHNLARRFGGWRMALERASLGHMYFEAVEGYRRKHSDDELLEEVRRVARLVDRPVLTLADFHNLSSIGDNPLRARFGDWRDVLERAGLGHMYSGVTISPGHRSHHRYTDNELLQEVRRVAGLVNKPVLIKADFGKHACVSAEAVARRFGGWEHALERAGIGHMYSGGATAIKSSQQSPYTEEFLLEEIRRVAGIVEKPVLMRKDFDSRSRVNSCAIKRRFGGWRDALERAGVGHLSVDHAKMSGRHRKKYSDEELVTEVRRVAGALDKPYLSHTDFKRHSRMSVDSIVSRFGGWREALERAGVGHMCPQSIRNRRIHPRTHSDEELLAELQRVAGLVDNPFLSRSNFDAYSAIASRTISNRYGGWREALKRAGLSHKYAKAEGGMSACCTRYSDDDLLEELRRVARLVDKPTLTRADFDRHSKACAASVYIRFGGWHVALERAGLGRAFSKPVLEGYTRLASNCPDEVLLDEVRRVAGIVGKPVLTRGDFSSHSRVNADTIIPRFGSWQATLERAGVGDMYPGGTKGRRTMPSGKL